MLHTQIELTSPKAVREVWWIPVPEGRAKVGEKITRQGDDWVITAVCTTLQREDIPEGGRIATDFFREAQTIAFMTI